MLSDVTGNTAIQPHPSLDTARRVPEEHTKLVLRSLL